MAASMTQKHWKRFIWSSLQKRRHLVNRKQHTNVATSEFSDEPEYPPVKPRFPEGKDWGSMPSKVAWIWDNDKQEVKKYVTALVKLNHLTKGSFRTWKFPNVQLQPETLPYQLYIMKTSMAEGLPGLFETVKVSENLNLCKSAVLEMLETEAAMNRDKFMRKRTVNEADYNLTHTRVKEILTALYSSLVGSYEHLFNSQFDEAITVQAFWDRHGVKRYWPKEWKLDPDFKLQDNSRFQADHTVNFQIRVEKPLPEFYPRSDELKQFKFLEFNKLDYRPSVLGQFTETLQHKVCTGAKVGSPFEFTSLSVVLSNHRHLNKIKIVSGEKYAEQSLIGYGIMTSFTSAVAQAYYQGFNTYEELTYPFTTQTIVTDGQHYTFFAYQLNTLQMWLDNTANPLRNVCWVKGPLKLYDTIEDGKVKGFNDETLEHLLKFICLEPVDRGIDLRPNLTPEDDKVSVSEYIERKKLVVHYDEPVRYAPER